VRQVGQLPRNIVTVYYIMWTPTLLNSLADIIMTFKLKKN